MADNNLMAQFLINGGKPAPDNKRLSEALMYPDGAAFGVGSPSETAQQPSGLATIFGGAYDALGSMAKRAFGSSEMMRQTGVYDPAPMVEAAMLPMGTGAIAGVPVKGAETVLGACPIRAYHGSPHDFDKFDLSKIGTGEGAQAYGHGLYFAENEGVAKGYRNKLSDAGTARVMGGMTPKEEYVFDRISGGASEMDVLRDFASRYGGSFDDANAALEKVKALNKGKMYEVNINANPEHFLDWDKPLAGQSGAVGEALGIGKLPQKPSSEEAMAVFKRAKELGVPAHTLPEYSALQARMDSANSDAWKALGIQPSNVHMRPEEMSGAQLYQAFEQGKLAPHQLTDTRSPAVAARLREAGIPGIKYLDQGSRVAGQGSSNYVVFDDKLIDIMKKYAMPGLLGAPPAYAMSQTNVEPY